MTDLQWQDPPEPKTGGAVPGKKWGPVQDALKSRPGEWALVAGDVSRGVAPSWRRGVGGWTADFEIETRSNEDGNRRCSIWARYIGGAK